ncbi:hypothetical protein [Sporosarcina sp. FSL K6-3457]|uniref:hypothetical protein n=1 Tax=Sporosarcina sp. FSL K6-3457 TaxID=2978204 RepID=UPI0030F8C09B
MTEERKQQIVEEQIEMLVNLNKNEGCEPEQIRLNCETILNLLNYLPNARKVNFE